MTTPAWVAKLVHEMIVFMALRGLRLPPRDIEELRSLLHRSIGAHQDPPDEDSLTPTDPGFKHRR